MDIVVFKEMEYRKNCCGGEKVREIDDRNTRSKNGSNGGGILGAKGKSLRRDSATVSVDV